MKSAPRWRQVSQAQSELRNVAKGSGALCCSLELPYATNSDGKTSSLVMGSFVTFVSTMVSNDQSHFQQRQT
jgi:hypothetical protein